MRSYPAVVKSPQSSLDDGGADIGFTSGASHKLSDPRSSKSFVTVVDDASVIGFVG